jgi:hexosaminidase
VQANLWTEHIRTESRVEYMAFPRVAALAEVAWSAQERIDWADFSRRLPTQLERYRALGIGFADEGEGGGPQATNNGENPARLTSHDLTLCSEHIALSLEDDAPLHGERAVFLVDIMNPCWKLPDADLSQPQRLEVAVGQVPFNFQIGADVEKIELRPPRTRAGELEIRLGCEGELLSSLSLAPAVGAHAVSELPAVVVPARGGRHELCFRFTQAQLDPVWVLHSVALTPATPERTAE